MNTNNINENLETSQSQESKILDHMLRGYRITQLEATELFGCTRLAARIADIEKRIGRAPKREMVSVKNRYGNTVRVMQYWL